MSQNEKNIIRLCLGLMGCLMLLKTNGQNMKKHRWKNRILIVKTWSEQDSRYQEQLKEYSDSNSDFKNRKLVLYEVIGNKYKMTDYQKLKANIHWQNLPKINEDIFDPLNKYEVILIGLDGGVKLKKTDILRKEELYSIIDRMPMRLEEIRNEERDKHSEGN